MGVGSILWRFTDTFIVMVLFLPCFPFLSSPSPLASYALFAKTFLPISRDDQCEFPHTSLLLPACWGLCLYDLLPFLLTQQVKNPPAMQETWVPSLGWEDLLEERMATHSSTLAWRIPMDRGAWQATVRGVQESNMTEQLCTAQHLLQQTSVVVQLLSHIRVFATPWIAACQAFLSFPISQSLLKLMSVKSVMPSNHTILCRPCLLLPSIFPSIRVFPSELALCIMWPEYWNFSISPSTKYSGLISFRIDWFDLLAVQETLKSLQHHSSKASVLWHSAFFIVQLSHPYMTTGKIIALIIWTFAIKVMSLLFNILSRFYGLPCSSNGKESSCNAGY